MISRPFRRLLRTVMLSIVTALCFGAAPLVRTAGADAGAASDSATASDPRFDFSEDWFSGNIPRWKRFLEPYRGRPNLNYLEIGAFEGRATVWMAQNILTHPTARLSALDVFPGTLKDRFVANLEASGYEGQSTVIVGPSQQTLLKLEPDSFDIIYIDGSHQASDVLVDVVLSWRLLRQRGMLIFDDYRWKPDLPPELRPRAAIDAFVTTFRREIAVVDRDYQLMIRKRVDPCMGRASSCTVFGRYLYLWDKRNLVDPRPPGEAIQLSEAERDVIESLSLDARHDEAGVYVPSRVVRSADFIGLRKKLRLHLIDQVTVPDGATTR